MTAMADAVRPEPGPGMSLADILKVQFSPLRLVTGIAAFLLLGTASAILLDSPWALPGLLWYVATPWVILAGMARTPAGPAPHFQRFVASIAYPGTLAVVSSAAAMLETGTVAPPTVALVWAFALPVALQRWQQWRDADTPSRIAGTAALLLFVIVQVAITISAVDVNDWIPRGTPLPAPSSRVFLGVMCAGLLLLLAAGLAPTLWATLPGIPVFTLILSLGGWQIVVVLGTTTGAWLALGLMAFISPMFSGPPGRYSPRRILFTPTGAALALATLAGVTAAVVQDAGLSDLVRESPAWRGGSEPVTGAVPALWIAVLHLYLVRDLAVWRLLADLSPGEPVGAVMWLFWAGLLHGAGMLCSHLGLPLAAAAVFSVPWFADGFGPHQVDALAAIAAAAAVSAALVLAIAHVLGTRRRSR